MIYRSMSNVYQQCILGLQRGLLSTTLYTLMSINICCGLCLLREAAFFFKGSAIKGGGLKAVPLRFYFCGFPNARRGYRERFFVFCIHSNVQQCMLWIIERVFVYCLRLYTLMSINICWVYREGLCLLLSAVVIMQRERVSLYFVYILMFINVYCGYREGQLMPAVDYRLQRVSVYCL